MSKQQAIVRYQKAQELQQLQAEVTSLVQTEDYPEEMESIAELVFSMDARIEALEYKIAVLKDVLRKIQATNQQRKITLDSKGVTALVAKRRTNGAYSMIHERCMENARDDVAEFFKEIGISTEN